MEKTPRTKEEPVLEREKAALVVVDVQTRLLPSIHEGEETLRQITRAIRGFQIIGAPVLATEQYTKGLGTTHPVLQEVLTTEPPEDGALPDYSQPVETHVRVPGFEAPEKMAFSCAADEGTLAAIEGLDRPQIVLVGIEAHVCVLQTALHLVQREFETFVLADAVSSRKRESVEIALRRMEQEGVKLATVEMAMFELLHVSGTVEFKRWLRFIR